MASRAFEIYTCHVIDIYIRDERLVWEIDDQIVDGMLPRSARMDGSLPNVLHCRCGVCCLFGVVIFEADFSTHPIEMEERFISMRTADFLVASVWKAKAFPNAA